MGQTPEELEQLAAVGPLGLVVDVAGHEQGAEPTELYHVMDAEQLAELAAAAEVLAPPTLLSELVADAAAAAVAAVLPALAPQADAAKVTKLARAAALDACHRDRVDSTP